jgi:CRP/FNR family transcriptional regulator, nitrogen fixation regulation protein
MSLSAAVAPRSPFGAQNSPETERIRLIGMTVHVVRDQEVFGEGEPADHVYKVVRGAVRGFRVLSDGRRQICDFYLPGDIFGIERGAEHRITAEALTDTILVVSRRSALGHESDATAVLRLWDLAMIELRRSQDHTVTLGRRSATERVAGFLVDMAERIGDGEHVELPMSRQDIADYLGLTIETVSRILTLLQISGMITLVGCRSVDLRKPRALAELCA